MDGPATPGTKLRLCPLRATGSRLRMMGLAVQETKVEEREFTHEFEDLKFLLGLNHVDLEDRRRVPSSIPPVDPRRQLSQAPSPFPSPVPPPQTRKRDPWPWGVSFRTPPPHLQHVVEGSVTEGGAGCFEGGHGVFGVVLAPPGHLGVMVQGVAEAFAAPLEFLPGLFELLNVPEREDECRIHTIALTRVSCIHKNGWSQNRDRGGPQFKSRSVPNNSRPIIRALLSHNMLSQQTPPWDTLTPSPEFAAAA